MLAFFLFSFSFFSTQWTESGGGKIWMYVRWMRREQKGRFGMISYPNLFWKCGQDKNKTKEDR